MCKNARTNARNSFVDKYVSMDPSNEAFFGRGSFVITDDTGGASPIELHRHENCLD
jgi:hypothetical protein